MSLEKVTLYVTKDYDIFKIKNINRPRDEGHVAQLKRMIEENGNLTSDLPVKCDHNMYVVDGQHTIWALQELGYPVYYTKSETLGADSIIRQINIGRKNWSWQDYASSYAKGDNKNYKILLDFYEGFNFNFSILDLYTNGGKRTDTHSYQNGEYKVLDKALAFKLLTQLAEIRDVLPFGMSNGLAASLYDVMTHPNYDHIKLINKLTKYGTQLHEWRRKEDWIRNIEDIYNINQPEATKVRFF